MMFIDGVYPVISRHPVGLVGACFFPRFRPSGFFEHFVYPMCLLFTPEIMNWSFSQPHVFDKIIIFPSFAHTFPSIFPWFSFALQQRALGRNQVLPSDDNPDVVSWRGWKWWIFHYGLPEGTGKRLHSCGKSPFLIGP